MASESPDARESPAGLNARAALVLSLFFVSGAAGLIYEVVWLQLLQLSVGSSAVSLGILLGTFMGGIAAILSGVKKYADARVAEPRLAARSR